MNPPYDPRIPPGEAGRGEKIDLSLFSVIPAKGGIQCFHYPGKFPDPGFHPALSGTEIQFFHAFRE
jgi:hypothetical protein